MSKSYAYITTTLPYVNADPHLGFALEIVQADAWARTQRLLGNEVIFNTGTDEHGLKIYQKAAEEKKDVQSYVDEYASKFGNLKKALNLSYTHFIRTTDKHHIEAAQEFWKRCMASGDIYKKLYQVKYCVGCELAKTDSELVDGKCPLHPTKELMLIDEENYFFRFSAYQEKLLNLYQEHPDFVQPSHRLEEITNFVSHGLEDFSISRLREKMPWGVPVPGDEEHVMYVWFDALVNYISTLGWPDNNEEFNMYWPGIQVAGKDNLRQQSAMWQAMLMSAGVEPTKQIFIHGFISSDGQKMSKSLGNVIDPYEVVATYGTDAVRYYLLREIPSLGDGDYSSDRMKQLYVSDLANELGNLVSRITTLAAKDELNVEQKAFDFAYIHEVDSYDFNAALEKLWDIVKGINKDINVKEPWKMEGKAKKELLTKWLEDLQYIAFNLQPFLPETASKIDEATHGMIHRIEPIFPRL